jgi:hypothetical protein
MYKLIRTLVRPFLVTGFALSSLHLHAEVQTMEKGEKISVGEGHAYSYVIYNHKHVPKTIGIALSDKAMHGLPSKMTEFSLKLPPGKPARPFRSIAINWNPLGHEPVDIYGLPHFDFHFYFITDAARQAIKCMDEDTAKCTKRPNTDFIAPYYVPTPAGVPMMGWHWLDSRSPELHGEKFTSTFIEGYYNGKMIFMEPMITREFLLKEGSVNRSISLPERFFYAGWYPKTYVVTHDKLAKVYRIELKNMKFAQ